ncbi:hypothetical protein [Leptotrichia hofstadii]|nr:hypothetical protein [Leptotrichia hofstadii]
MKEWKWRDGKRLSYKIFEKKFNEKIRGKFLEEVKEMEYNG